MAGLHRIQVQKLVAAADEEVVRIEDDEVIEVGCPCLLIGGGAIERVRQHGAAVAEVSRAQPCLKGDRIRREFLQSTHS